MLILIYSKAERFKEFKNMNKLFLLIKRQSA